MPSILGKKGICHTAAPSAVPFEKPSDFSPDDLTEVIRAGAGELLRTAVQAEVSAFVAEQEHIADESGRRRVMRPGSLLKWEVTASTGRALIRASRTQRPA